MFSALSLFPIIIVVLLSFAVMMTFYFDISKDKSARYWFIASILIPVGMVLTMLRDLMPVWIGYIGSVCISLYGWCLFFVSMEMFIKGHSNHKKYIAPILLYGIVFTYLVDVGSVFWASVISSSAWGLSNGYLAIEAWKLRSVDKKMSLVSFLYAVSLITWISRISLANHSELPMIHFDSFINWSTVGMNLVLLVLAQVSYFVMRYKLTLNENVSIKKLLEERDSLISKLKKANKTAITGALSASIAHEINQPLTASNINVQFLKKKIDESQIDSALYREVLLAIEKDNNRIANIVKSLKSIFRENEATATLISVQSLVDKAVEFSQSELKAKTITLEKTLDEKLMVEVNASEIEQVILNLINNAIQALATVNKPNKVIIIRAFKEKGYACIAVSDNGMGVAKELLDGLFELLTTNKETGMGLGLWLSKHIVSRYDGKIYYKQIIGEGAQFVVELPIAN